MNKHNVQVERMEKVLRRYFVDSDTLRYTPQGIPPNNNFLRYSFINSDPGRVMITVGSDDGLCSLKECTTAPDLEQLIKSLIY